MKKPLDYVPKYSLSIAILSEVMPKSELRYLIRQYVAKKVEIGFKKHIRNRK